MCRYIPTTNAALNNVRIEQTAADPSKDTQYINEREKYPQHSRAGIKSSLLKNVCSP
jgi:hypothetical protein